MLRILTMFSFVLANASDIASGAVCAVPDRSFKTFLTTFEKGGSFSELRLILPLEFKETGPEGTKTEKLSLERIRKEHQRLIIDTSLPDPNKGDEAELCQTRPVVRGAGATVTQYSCHTDVFGYTYHFTRLKGCWFLRSLETVGE